ncbi:MAG: hypothetical protein WA761_05640, partial [Thermoplasmata archaeon]
SQSLYTNLTNGTYDFTVQTNDASQIDDGAGFESPVIVDGPGSVVAGGFYSRTWNVDYSEVGLPPGVTWFVTQYGYVFSGLTLSSPSGSDIYAPAYDGSYSFNVSSTDPKYAPSYTPNFTVDNQNVRVTVTFALYNSTATFSPVDLPSGDGWYVNISGGPSLQGTASTVLSASLPNGTYSFDAATSDPLYAPSFDPNFTVNGSAVGISVAFSIGTIMVDPLQGPVGAAVTVSGTGFSSSTTLRSLVFDAVSVTGCSTGSLSTSVSGSFSCSFQVPSGTSGSSVIATNAGGQTANGMFTVTTPTITLKPLQGPVGGAYQVKGAGFTVSSGATVAFHVVLETPNECSRGTFTGTTITTNATGGFLCSFTVPSESTGSYPVVGEDLSTTTSSSPRSFLVTVPKITLGVSQGPQGARYTVSGAGFSAASGAAVSFGGAVQTPTACSTGTFTGTTITTASGSGAFRCSFTVPSEIAGHYTVFGVDRATGTQTAARSFKVTVPTITVTPDHGLVSGADPAIATYTAIGTGFSVSSGATITFNGALQTPSSCSRGTYGGTAITTTGGGAFECTFTVPTSVAGHYPVVGTDTATGLTSTRTFSVT